ncbi:hypothetical protein GCM10007103_25420 [Salinimicrobium marinum]|uniref:TonB protein C-terminal n=1 Tax=Salinimicrobium marinum TaxID=680283 RepID=A0A918SHU6_9FLAO|nr:hypothetical protein [Salinimicrobium marinum]GHA43104.1 hypothetical protein GCM10007103_25420 [Salinimicrobium marinum]
MKKALFLLLIILISGCERFETKKISSEEILSEETRELNWHEVDQYPAFKECKEITEVEAAKTCFGNKVASYVYARLDAKQPVVSKALEDTLLLYLSISDRGVPAIDSVEIDTMVTHHLPEIKTWLRESIDSLPNIYPATKRGIPVATKFKMPIVIKAE